MLFVLQHHDYGAALSGFVPVTKALVCFVNMSNLSRTEQHADLRKGIDVDPIGS